MSQNVFGFPKEQPACLAQFDMSRRSIEQMHLKLGLELVDVMNQ